MAYPSDKTKKAIWKSSDYQLFLMASLGILFLFVFAYIPMYGVVLAFKDGDSVINVLEVMISGEWVGFKNFVEFFQDEKFIQVLFNTIWINLLMLAINFPAPILFALLLNEVQHKAFKRTVQTISTFPHFLSWAIFGGILLAVTNVNTGVVNAALNFLGLSSAENPVNLASAQYIWLTLIFSSLLKGVGWGSIIYLAAISGINPEQYEAASIDGANRFQSMLRITLPSIAPTITVFLLLNLSSLMDNSFEQFYIFQNTINLSKSEVLTTYIYKMSMGSNTRRFSYAAAMGLFNSLIGLLLLVIGNLTSKKITGKGVF